MNYYTSTALAALVDSAVRVKTHFLDTEFSILDVQETEEVFIDIKKSSRALAPFVSADLPGKAMDVKGYETLVLKPAYLKPLASLKPKRTLKRQAGERIGGEKTMIDRRAVILAETQQEQINSIIRRREFMAAEIMSTGKSTISGESYETRILDWRRDADLTLTLTGTDKWDQPDADPLGDLEEMAERVHELEGVTITRITMDPKAWRAFKKNKDVREILDNRRAAGGSAEFGGLALAEGAQFAGKFGLFDVYVYSEFYEKDGVTYPLLAPGTVIGSAGAQVNGIQSFGAIEDEEALKAMEFFSKSWVEPNPSVRYLMTQCAPLLIPGRRNSYFTLKVL